jgi:hypothetical protein
VFAHHQKHEALYRNLESAARIGLYVSNKSRRFDPAGGKLSQSAFRGAYRALVESGLAFDLVNEDRAIDGDFAETHVRYGTIVLSGASCLSDIEIRNLDAYVEAGGTLLAIGMAGEYDETGNERTTRLRSLPIEPKAGLTFDCRGGYLVLGVERLAGLDSDLVLLDGPYQPVTPKTGAYTLYRVLMPQPFGPPELCFTEEQPSDLPGAVVGAFGNGHAICVPFALDRLYSEFGLAEHRALLAALVTRHSGPQPISISRPGRIEVTLQRHEESGTFLVHLINYSGQSDNVVDDPVVMHGLSLNLHGLGVVTARALVADTELPIACNGEYQTLTVPPIGNFEVVHLRTG